MPTDRPTSCGSRSSSDPGSRRSALVPAATRSSSATRSWVDDCTRRERPRAGLGVPPGAPTQVGGPGPTLVLTDALCRDRLVSRLTAVETDWCRERLVSVSYTHLTLPTNRE